MAIGIKTGGRKKGSKNKITRELQSVIKEFVHEEMNRMPVLLEQLEPKERIDVLIRLLPYVIPKIASTQHIAEIEETGIKKPSFMDLVRKQYYDLNVIEQIEL